MGVKQGFNGCKIVLSRQTHNLCVDLNRFLCESLIWIFSKMSWKNTFRFTQKRVLSSLSPSTQLLGVLGGFLPTQGKFQQGPPRKTLKKRYALLYIFFFSLALPEYDLCRCFPPLFNVFINVKFFPFLDLLLLNCLACQGVFSQPKPFVESYGLN